MCVKWASGYRHQVSATAYGGETPLDSRDFHEGRVVRHARLPGYVLSKDAANRDNCLKPTHSHSMVPGGLLVMSSATLLTPGTSLMMRLETFSSRSYGRRAQSAVMASSEVTARITTGY